MEPLSKMVATRVKKIRVSKKEKHPVPLALNCGPAPFRGQTLYLGSGGTLPFALHGQHGWYDGNGTWRSLP